MAEFVIPPSTTALVIGLPANTEVTTDFPALLGKLIERLSETDRQRLSALRGCNLACNPLVCGGIVIQ